MNDTMRNELHYLATGRRTTDRETPVVNSGYRTMANTLGLRAVRDYMTYHATARVFNRMVAEMKRLYSEGFTWTEVDEVMFGVEPTSESELVARYMAS
jgi:hypothetical protein